jgi:quercetin dioxygenase-like cupin family protein
MRKFKKTITMVLFATLWNLNAKGQTNGAPKGERAPEENFTGIVWLNPLANDTLSYWSIAKVTFEAGAYSKWHTHPDKQILVIAEGAGYLKQKDNPVQILRKGDMVSIAPGVEHWHGAKPETPFVQIVINPNIQHGVVHWLRRVTELEYKSVK